MEKTILVYSTDWCPDSRRARAFLKRHRVAYENVNIDQNPEAAQIVEQITGGNRSVPTIVFPDGTILVEPGNEELAEKLGIDPRA